VIEPSLKTGSVDTGKSIGRVKVATPDVVGNINQIVQRNPHISVRPLSQQTTRSELIINLFPPLSKINFFKKNRQERHYFFTDEAWFHLSVFVISQNDTTWSANHPHNVIEAPSRPIKIDGCVATFRFSQMK
jgi:hypothetical protein